MYSCKNINWWFLNILFVLMWNCSFSSFYVYMLQVTKQYDILSAMGALTNNKWNISFDAVSSPNKNQILEELGQETQWTFFSYWTAQFPLYYGNWPLSIWVLTPESTIAGERKTHMTNGIYGTCRSDRVLGRNLRTIWIWDHHTSS